MTTMSATIRTAPAHDHEGEEHHHHHHHHHHEEDEEPCGCGDPNCHGHHADDVFVSWGIETARKFTEEELTNILEELDDCEKYGQVLRAKGIVDSAEGQWFHYDYTPGEYEIRRGAAGVTGRLCVIGSGLNEQALAELFN